jgi:PhzF family phenazine biosynthesis protein
MIPIFQVDAFTDKLFEGNPAAVCPLDYWLTDELMQKIAMENNLAETAFVVHEPEGLHIRWFTPAVEVDLCGHATLAAAHVLFNHLGYQGDEISFASKSGALKVLKNKETLTLDFPADKLAKVDNHTKLMALFPSALEIWKGNTDYMVVLKNQKAIEALSPDFKELSKIEARGIIVTAQGDETDFVSRFFAPQSGIDEDPVTGSAHTTLTVYWSEKFGKIDMTAIQLSARRGYLQCLLSGDRVTITGKCKTYLIGEAYLEG